MSRVPDNGGANWEVPDYYEGAPERSFVPLSRNDYTLPTYPVIDQDPAWKTVISNIPAIGWRNWGITFLGGSVAGYWVGLKQCAPKSTALFAGWMMSTFTLIYNYEMSRARIKGYFPNDEEIKRWKPELAKRQFSAYAE